MVCLSNLATRNLTSYLVTVPVPECVEICSGIPIASLCHGEGPLIPEAGVALNRVQMCHACRSNLAWGFSRENSLSRADLTGSNGRAGQWFSPDPEAVGVAPHGTGDALHSKQLRIYEMPTDAFLTEQAIPYHNGTTVRLGPSQSGQLDSAAKMVVPVIEDHSVSDASEGAHSVGPNDASSNFFQPEGAPGALSVSGVRPGVADQSVMPANHQNLEAASKILSVQETHSTMVHQGNLSSEKRSATPASPLLATDGNARKDKSAVSAKGMESFTPSKTSNNSMRKGHPVKADASSVNGSAQHFEKESVHPIAKTSAARVSGGNKLKLFVAHKPGSAHDSHKRSSAGKQKTNTRSGHLHGNTKDPVLIQQDERLSDGRILRHGRRKYQDDHSFANIFTFGRGHWAFKHAPDDMFLEKRDAGFFNMSEGVCMARWEYGLLTGYGFAIVFALGSAVAGYICDRKPRVAVASVATCVWSVALSMQASAHTFTFLFVCRGVIGLAQAFAMPAAITIAADYFPERQSAAEVVLSLGLYLGSGSASFSILLAEALGWRWVVLLAGLGGLFVAALLYFTVEEPERSEWTAPCTQAVVMNEVFDKSRVARMLLIAASAKMLAACSLSAFLPLWYSRSGLIGFTSDRYAVWNMLAISIGGVLSAIVGGFVSNIWSRRDPRAPCWVGVFGSLASMPLICVMIRTSYFGASISCLFLLLVVSESWFGPTIGLLQASVRRSVRGQAVSMFLVASTLVAYMGPAIVGFLDPGDADLGTSLLWVALLANAVSVVAFIWTAREVGVDPVAADAGYKFEPEAQVARSRPGRSGGKQALIPPRGTTPWFFF